MDSFSKKIYRHFTLFLQKMQALCKIPAVGTRDTCPLRRRCPFLRKKAPFLSRAEIAFRQNGSLISGPGGLCSFRHGIFLLVADTNLLAQLDLDDPKLRGGHDRMAAAGLHSQHIPRLDLPADAV